MASHQQRETMKYTKENVTNNDLFGLRQRASRVENLKVVRMVDDWFRVADEAALAQALALLNEGK